MLSGFKDNQKRALEDLLRSYGIKLPGELSNAQKDSMACPALPTCGLAITESERALPAAIDQIESELARLGLSEQRIVIRMTGCPNGCSRPYNADIAFVGKSVGTYNVYVGGNLIGDRLNFVFAEKVTEKALATTVIPLLSIYKKERKLGESFGDYCFRVGKEKLQKVP